MMVDVLQAKKQEVAESMFNDFKNELNFFQSTVLSFFDKKITQTITSNVQVGASLEDAKPRMNFFEKLLIQLSPTAAEKVFMFIKEKQEQLVKANTVEELENLKKGIIVPPEVKPENQPVANPVQAGPNDQNNQTNIPQPTPKQDSKDQEFPDGNKKIENIVVGASTGVGLGLSSVAADQLFKLQQKNKLASSINIEDPEGFASRLENEFAKASRELEKDASNPKLLKVQQSMMKKSAKEFEKISKDLNKDTFTSIEMMYKLEKKLPQSLLKSIDADEGAKLAKLLSEDAEFVTKLGKAETTVKDIEEILEVKGIKNINKEVIIAMKGMKGAEELQGLTHILTNMKGIKSFMRGVKGIAFLDLISTGFDVRVLCEGLDEAEAYEKLNALRASTAREHQRVQFGASLALTALSIIAACAAGGSAGGPIGTAVGAAIGAAGFAASQAIDIFYDAVEYYEQNKEDFKKQYRTEIKQAIIQTAATEEWNLNINSKTYAEIKMDKKNIATTSEAWRTLIRQEEYKAFPLVQKQFTSEKNEDDFIKTLSPEDQSTYKDQQKSLNIIIDQRMDYVKKHMYENKGTPEYKSFVAEMKNNMGIKAIERILTESKLYYKMNQTATDEYVTGAKTIAEYVQLFGAKVSAEYPEGFKALEIMWNNQHYAVQELCGSVERFSSVFANAKQNPNYEHQDKIPQMEKNIAFIKRYMEYKKLTLPIEEQKKLDIPLRAVDLPMVERLLISGDFAALGSITFNSDQAKSYFTRDWIAERKDAKTEYSDSVGQNIIYRIAKEIHGYEGNNDAQELIEFFREDKGAALGLYYSNGWKINNDWAIDKSIDIKDVQNMKPDDILKMWVSPARINEIFNVLDPLVIAKAATFGPLGLSLPGSLFGFTDDASRLDTKADAGDMDKKMNLEYRSRLRKIIREEKGYEVPIVKKMVEENIITYIKTYAKEVPKKIQKDGNVDASAGQEQGYIELPYYLIIAAKRAKIGNLENFLFKYQDNKIIACTSFTHSKDEINFSETKIATTKEYINLGQQVEYQKAMPYITYVDKARDKFKELIDFNDNDLDLPVEYRDLYNKKIQDRERFKYDLLNMDPELAQKKLLDNYESYHDRFDSMYTAMLTKISKSSRSNDIDDAQQLQEAESRANKLNAVTIKDGIIQGSPDMFSKNQKKIFYRILGEWKPRGKDILAMASSKNSDENDKAIRSVKQIIKSMIEAQVVDFDEQGAIKSIVNGKDKEFENDMLDSNGLIQEKIKNLVFKRVLVNGNPANYFIPPTIEVQKMDEEKVQITPVQ